MHSRDIWAEPHSHNQLWHLQVQINLSQNGVLKEEKASFSNQGAMVLTGGASSWYSDKTKVTTMKKTPKRYQVENRLQQSVARLTMWELKNKLL